MIGIAVIEALAPVVIGMPVTVRVQLLSPVGGAFPFVPEDGDWDRIEIPVVLASAQCDFPGSDEGKGTTRGSLTLFRSGRCVAFEAVAVPHDSTDEGLVSMLALFDHRGLHSGQAERTFYVEASQDD